MIIAGRKIRGGIVALVSKDQRLVAIHCPDDLGNQGRIYAVNTMPESRYSNNGYPTIVIDGVGYHIIEYNRDYPELCRRFFWYTNSYASAYREV